MDKKTRPPLAVGQVWRTRDGEKVTIDLHDFSDPEYPFRAAGLWYTAGGLCCDGDGDDPDDLIELLSPTPPTPTPPTPATPLAVGQTWRTRDGEVLTIDERDPSDTTDFPFYAQGSWYRADGTCCLGNGDDPDDLIELLSEAPAPAAPPTPRRFAETPRRTVWPNGKGYTLDALADDGTAWWMMPNDTCWHQLPPLPDREVSHD